METNANSLMAKKNYLNIVKRLKMETKEQKNANIFGIMEPVVMDLVANFFTFQKFHPKRSNFLKEYKKSCFLRLKTKRVNSLNYY